MTKLSQRNSDQLRRQIDLLDASKQTWDAARLFRAVASRQLLGASLEDVEAKVDEQLAAPPLVKDPRLNAETLVQLAAAALLLGRSPDRPLAASLEYVGAAGDVYGQGDQRVLSAEMGASALLDDAALSGARDRRLKKQYRGGSESVDFAELYLSSRNAIEDGIERISLFAAAIVADVVCGDPAVSAAPTVTLLARLLGADRDVASALYGKAMAVDEAVFGSSGGTPRFAYGKPSIDVTTTPSPALLLGSTVRGEGELKVGPELVSIFTDHLTKTVFDALYRARGKKAWETVTADLLNKREHALAVVLALGKGVSITADSEAALGRRFEVAWEHLRHHRGEVRAGACIEVKPHVNKKPAGAARGR